MWLPVFAMQYITAWHFYFLAWQNFCCTVIINPFSSVGNRNRFWLINNILMPVFTNVQTVPATAFSFINTN
jgi:hypothetical protein